MEYEYPLDLTGIAPANLIKDEPQVITEINGRHSQIIIPDYAPFYLDNQKVVHVETDGSETILTRDVDYFVAYPYQDLARESGKLAFGAIVIIRQGAVNRFKISYQTLGDKWVADPNYVKTVLLEKAYNPRFAYWDQMTNVQDKFPPQSHEHDVTESDKYPALLEAINRVTEAILTRDYNESSIYPTVVSYLNRHMPELTSLTALGLDMIENLPIATIEEIQQRLKVRKYITVEQVLEIIDADVTVPNKVKFDVLDSAIASILQTLAANASTLSDHTRSIAANAQSLSELNNILTTFGQGVNGRFDAVNQEIARMRDETITTLRNETNQSLAAINQDLERIQNETISTLRSETDQALRALNATVVELSQQIVTQLQSDLRELSGEVSDRFANMDQLTSGHGQRLQDAEQHLAAIQEQIDKGTIARNSTLPSPFTYYISQ